VRSGVEFLMGAFPVTFFLAKTPNAPLVACYQSGIIEHGRDGNHFLGEYCIVFDSGEDPILNCIWILYHIS
jgi:hypothetical protein